MGSSIGFFCGNADLKALRSFGESIGLIVIAPKFDKEINDDASTGPYCFFSTVGKSELHPFGNPPVRLTDARDPIMRFMRGYFKAPYLVAGHVYWSDDVKELAAKTKPYFQKTSKWIKTNWELHPGGGFYIGPEAKSLIDTGSEMVNFLPGTVEEKTITI
jgi:hypothetical protein